MQTPNPRSVIANTEEKKLVDELTLQGLESLSEQMVKELELQRQLSCKGLLICVNKIIKPFLGSLYGKLRRLWGILTYLSLSICISHRKSPLD
jgi:hypothetical protein